MNTDSLLVTLSVGDLRRLIGAGKYEARVREAVNDDRSQTVAISNVERAVRHAEMAIEGALQ